MEFSKAVLAKRLKQECWDVLTRVEDNIRPFKEGRMTIHENYKDITARHIATVEQQIAELRHLHSNIDNYAQGHRGESCPTDVIGNAVKIARLVTGEDVEELAHVSPGAALGKLGGQARARNMTPEARAEQAREAAAKRWNK